MVVVVEEEVVEEELVECWSCTQRESPKYDRHSYVREVWRRRRRRRSLGVQSLSH